MTYTAKSAGLLAVTTTAALLLSSTSTLAQCVPNPPSARQTVTCSGQLDTNGITAPSVDDVTVEIEGPSGGISVAGAPGIQLGDDATINVAGDSIRPVTTSGDLATAI
ncbi:MAG: hypothetical protein ACU0CI_00320 [Shimia sp.]